ncbi:DNA-binding protein [Pseudomonas aeruginosa]|uniref:DNA-binding protein n=2 Tax=Pseudomonas aeruginosa TaxID=287 RepID=UPI001A33F22B|nr:DNA-binding protein [Pseudomonas aeruginosa]EKQ6360107.1 DNA-binding protein [Pseudomonas aeruginosa]MBI7438558.1 DNA-binding protein [Pseudomonas aeruginosa]MCA6826327.1 DNA-binding protein [Pseudomonas aeruginosa]MCA6832145.1 DNA-binding protein [Pseudomonas aeruginosa]MCO2225317.1 DNA-binding protein [Pseudomonas aeruginosa]
MELEEFQARDAGAFPPVMPWREFADWIRMGDCHDVVWGWIRNGYIPSRKVGKHMMVNVALLTSQLMDEEIRL